MPSSGDDPVGAALGRAAAWVLDALSRCRTNAPVVLIDGRSGSGKSTLAAAIAQSASSDGAPVTLLALDTIYPGWDGLASASDILAADILQPRADGLPGRWRRWDWEKDRPAESSATDPRTPLIVEGAGALTPRTAPLADITVWLESPAVSRRERALARDGDTYRPHWERWAAQEREHARRHAPARWATHVFTVP
ncbi:hypothetical protein ACQ143_02600 [Microbacterium sp. MC2]